MNEKDFFFWLKEYLTDSGSEPLRDDQVREIRDKMSLVAKKFDHQSDFRDKKQLSALMEHNFNFKKLNFSSTHQSS